MKTAAEIPELEDLCDQFWKGEITPAQFRLRIAAMILTIEDPRVIESVAQALRYLKPRM